MVLELLVTEMSSARVALVVRGESRFSGTPSGFSEVPSGKQGERIFVRRRGKSDDGEIKMAIVGFINAEVLADFDWRPIGMNFGPGVQVVVEGRGKANVIQSEERLGSYDDPAGVRVVHTLR